LFINEGDKIKIDTASGSYMDALKNSCCGYSVCNWTEYWPLIMNTKFMKFNKVHSLQEIANLLKCESVGDKNFEILGMNEIHVVEKVISFL
jgi:hypothetical protein